MALTPLLVTALDGLLQNDSIDINKDLLKEIDEYVNKPIVKSYRELLSGHYYYPFELDPPLKLSNFVLILEDLYSDMPGLVDIQDYNHCGISSKYLTESILDWSYIILSTHRSMSHVLPTAKYIEIFQTVSGSVANTNTVINTINNSSDIAPNTFTSSNELATGNLTAVSTDTLVFGNDLLATGKLLDFDVLKFYGTPHALTLGLIRTNSIVLIEDELNDAGISIDNIKEQLQYDDIELPPKTQKLLYDVYKTITGSKLNDMLLIINVTTEGISSLADLLDTAKIFPNSINYLQSMQDGKLVPLLSVKEIETGTLANILSENMAIYNIAFRYSLYQIKGIESSLVKNIANQFIKIEQTTGLDNVNAFEQPVLPEVTESILNTIPNGSAPDKTLYVGDGIGTPAGINQTELFVALNKYHDELSATNVNAILEQTDLLKTMDFEVDLEWIENNPEPIFQEPGYESETPTEFKIRWQTWEDARLAFIKAINDSMYDSWFYISEFRADNPMPLDDSTAWNDDRIAFIKAKAEDIYINGADPADPKFPPHPEPEPDPEGCDPCPWFDWEEARLAFIDSQVAGTEEVFNPEFERLYSLVLKLTPLPDDIQDLWQKSTDQIDIEKKTIEYAYDWRATGSPDYPAGDYDGGMCAALWNTIQLPSSQKIVTGFVNGLHSLSDKTNLYDAVEVIERISKDNMYGEALIGSMREGRNLRGLDEAGVLTDTKIDDNQKNPRPGNIT